MMQLEAMHDTVRLAEKRGYKGTQPDASLEHFRSMLSRATEGRAIGTFSEAKLGRWLGYIQGALVAERVLTLGECKSINQKWAD